MASTTAATQCNAQSGPSVAGESIPADLSTWEFILLQPNTYRLLSEYMLDPDRLFEYVSTRCQTEVVQKPKAEAYSNLLPMDEQPLLDAQLTHVQCVDTFGAYEQYARCAPDTLFR